MENVGRQTNRHKSLRMNEGCRCATKTRRVEISVYSEEGEKIE
jgi:hypothetical protein